MARFGFFKTRFRRELSGDSPHIMAPSTKLPFTIEEFTQVYNNPLVKDILFGKNPHRKFLDTGLTADSPIEEIANLVATHMQKAALSWELVQYQQRRKHADSVGEAGPGMVAHTVSDRKLNRFLSAILSESEVKQEDLLFGHSPYLSACMTGGELTYFRVNPSTLQAKLILEFDPHQIIFTAPRDIWSATMKHNSKAILDTFFHCLSRNDVSAKILAGLIYVLSEERNPIEIRRQIDNALKMYLADSEVYSLDPAKSKYPLEHHHGYTPQSLMARTPHTIEVHGQKRPYNEILIGRHENIRVVKIVIEESDWQAAENAASMGNIDAQNGIEKLQEAQRSKGIIVERVPDTEPRFKLPADANSRVRLNYAVFTHNKKMIEELLGPLNNPTEKGTMSDAELGEVGQSLQTACYVGDIAVINKLLDISPHLIHHAQEMPLLTAVYRRNEDLVKLLMARGANPEKCRRELQVLIQTKMADPEREQYKHLLSLESINVTHGSTLNGCIEYLPKAMCGSPVYRLDPEHLPNWDDITELPPTEVWQSLVDNYINVPYEDDWEKRFAVEDKIVYRPNHDVTHAIRQQGYMDFLIHKIETEGKTEYRHLITKEVHSLLSLTAFICLAGRTNEHRAFADPRNMERSANIVTAIARRYKFNPDLIEIVARCISNNETTIETDAETGAISEKLVKLMRTLLSESYAIDMVRMLTKDDFERKFKPSMEIAFRYFFDDNLEKELIEDTLIIAQRACKSTGNMCVYAGEYEDNLKLKARCVHDITYGTAQMMDVLNPYLENPAALSTLFFPHLT